MERRVAVRELNQRTSAVLSEVARGIAITITRDGLPIARLVPISRESSSLDRLVFSGRAISPSTGGPLTVPPTYDAELVDVAAALAADRADERW